MNMKRTLLVLTLALTPSCKALGAAFSGGDEGPSPEAQAAGSTAGAIATTVTGNPAIGAAVGAAATAIAMVIYGKRKKKPAS